MSDAENGTPGQRVALRHDPERRLGHWSLGTRMCVLGVVLALGACATKPVEPPAPAPRIEGLPELMHQAETAAAAGDKDKAREAYRAAAKAEPTNKQPWVALSRSYFEAGDYGNAILAAQEVLQRDGTDGPDSVAAGILTVSGLRVSTAGVSILRQQNNFSGSTRSEAETLARNLRELLGEPVLVPPAADSTPPVRPRARARPKAPTTPPVAKAATPAPAATSAAPPPPAAAAASPFDKLK